MAARNTEQTPEVEPDTEQTPEVEPDTEQTPEVEGYTKLKSPSGAVTSVPDSIKDTLIEVGYKPVRK